MREGRWGGAVVHGRAGPRRVGLLACSGQNPSNTGALVTGRAGSTTEQPTPAVLWMASTSAESS